MWLRGDCHVHSLRSSGGEMTPAQVVAAARELGYDFLAATEHNTTDTWAEWNALATDDLLIIPGLETTTPAGHWLTLDDRVSVAAHPRAPYPGGTLERSLHEFDLAEVWNGLWQSSLWWNADNEAGLTEWSRGLGTPGWPAAVGNSDTHLAGQLGVPFTVVRVSQRTGNAVLEGLRAGRSWISGSTAIDLEVTATAGEVTAGIGDRLAAGSAVVTVRVGGLSAGVVTVHTEKGIVHSSALPRRVACEVGGSFVRVQIRHPDGDMAALTNPIWLL